jgi:hypothetical protein
MSFKVGELSGEILGFRGYGLRHTNAQAAARQA